MGARDMIVTSFHPRLLVLECGQMTLCDTESSEQRLLGLGECLEIMASGTEPAMVGRTPDRAAPPSASVEVPAVVDKGAPCACIAGGGAAYSYADAEQRWVRLDEAHIRVTAALWYTSTVGELADRAGVPEADVSRALVDLLTLGIARPWSAPDDTRDGAAADISSTGSPEPAPAPPALVDSPSGPRDGRGVPVLSFWATAAGPSLGSAAVVAYARVHDGGRLNDVFDLRKTARAEQVLDELRQLDGPAILLASNYIWSLDANLEVARAAVEANPRTIVIHGGPSTPRYEQDCDAFLRALPGNHLLVNGEGELTFAAILSAFAASGFDNDAPLEAVRDVAGVQFLDRVADAVVATERRERHPHLEDFPSPMVSGELDDVDLELLRKVPLSIETNRGCPYSCTFCDWGQNTMSRIRKFPEERVAAEFAWLAAHGIEQWVLADANFGILKRDVDIADQIVASRHRTGYPHWIQISPQKNATARVVEMVDRLLSAGISMKTSLALQSRDAATLETIRRTNISTEGYDHLAEDLRRRGLPLAADLMMGLPGSTLESFAADLQWCIDFEVRGYIWPTFVLPNSPMNAPDYRDEHAIRTVNNVVVETATFTAEERREMSRFAYGYQAFEVLGVLRHVLRYLQWDQGLPAMETVRRIVATCDADPQRFPALAFLLRHADVFLVPPVGWAPLFAEVHELLVDDLGVADLPELRTVLEINQFLLPSALRKIPDAIEVDHDYAAYFAEAQAHLGNGQPSRPTRRLDSYGPGVVELLADPDDVCGTQLRRLCDVRGPDGFIGDFSVVHLELLSSVLVYPPMSAVFVSTARSRRGDGRPDGPPSMDADPGDATGFDANWIPVGAPIAVGMPTRGGRRT